MKTNLFATLTVAALSLAFASTSNAVVREGGGIGNMHLIYQCTQVNPTDPSNPIVATLSQYPGAIHLMVRTKKTDANGTQGIIYSNNVLHNETIRCMVACDIYDAKNDGVRFGVTALGQFNSGNFNSPKGTLNFNCERGANPMGQN